jgi:hypothetical protein
MTMELSDKRPFNSLQKMDTAVGPVVSNIFTRVLHVGFTFLVQTAVSAGKSVKIIQGMHYKCLIVS